MNPLAARLSLLASLLDYPGGDLETWLRDDGTAPSRDADSPTPADGRDTAATAALDRFAAGMRPLAPETREELYTGTFEVAPACVPYVSIHLFGEENFKRGEFLAALQARYAQTGFHTGGELPDHLAILLRFAAQTNEPERRELVEFCLLGPVTRMLKSLSETNPYGALLEAVRQTLQEAYPGLQPAASPFEQMRQHGMPCDSPCGCSAKTPHTNNDQEADAGVDPTFPPRPHRPAPALSPRL